jgi:large subunit ribosomal protein L9
MEVILTQNVEGLGTLGQTVRVKDGYARNFLIPRGLAVPADRAHRARLNAMQMARLRAVQKEKEAALALASRLEGRVWTIAVPVGDQGKLHGAVTSMDVAECLKKGGIHVDKRAIDLERPLTHLGEFRIPVALHPEVKVVMTLQVVSR